jgi:hypothetical protein
VDLDNDRENCGECGTECPEGRACVEASCRILCPPGQTECSGACVSLDRDPANCGACGTACRDDQICQRSACACSGSRTDCRGVCVDTRVDPDNCGACGTACAATEACVEGECTVTCPRGTTACGGFCVDISSNRSHCGECDNACAEGESCVDGECSGGTVVPGDTCASPIDVTGGGRFTGSTAAAGADYSGGCGGVSGREVVFRYTLAETSDVFINTFGSSFDTLVYMRSSCGGGADIACNDDARDVLQSEIRLLDQAPGTYYVFLDAWGTGSGDYSFDIYMSAPSSRGGDACGEAEWVDISTVETLSGNTCPLWWINYRDDTQACGRGTGGLDQVYYFVVTARTEVTFATCGAAEWDTILDLRQVCNDETADGRVTCDDDSCDPGLQSTITATLDPGVYYLWLDGFNADACGSFEISVTR